MPTNELVADKYIRITFAGSFQARLATNRDHTGSSPKVPAPEDGNLKALGRGWTFAYDELDFDRVIRLSSPVQLRSALVDPWEDTKITKVEVSASALGMVGGYWGPMVAFPGDPLVGQVVSFGDAKFSEKKGGGQGYEVLDEFAFSIGGSRFTARQAQLTKMAGVNGRDEWRSHYLKTKTQQLAGALAAMHPARRTRLTEMYSGDKNKAGAIPRHIGTYSSFYAAESDMPNIPLTQVGLRGNFGILSDEKLANKLAWTLSLNFSRFDGDTLTGRVRGLLEGQDAQLDRGKSGP